MYILHCILLKYNFVIVISYDKKIDEHDSINPLTETVVYFLNAIAKLKGDAMYHHVCGMVHIK